VAVKRVIPPSGSKNRESIFDKEAIRAFASTSNSMVLAKELYKSAKEPNKSAKEPYTPAKEPCKSVCLFSTRKPTEPLPPHPTPWYS